MNNIIASCIQEHAPFTWQEFNALPFRVTDGAKSFWEPGYNYSDPDFWASYPDDVQNDMEAIHAVQMYDWLMRHDPDGNN